MPERSLRVLTGLASLLVVAGANEALGDRGTAAIGSAHARPLVQDEGDEAWDEDVAEESGSAQEEDSADASEWSGEEPAAEEEEEAETESADEPAAAEETAESTESAATEPAPAGVADASEPASQGGSQASSRQQRVREILHRHIREIVQGLEHHEIQDSDSLMALGANSVDRSEIMMMTMESLGIQIPLVELAKANNIGELADLMAAKLP